MEEVKASVIAAVSVKAVELAEATGSGGDVVERANEDDLRL